MLTTNNKPTRKKMNAISARTQINNNKSTVARIDDDKVVEMYKRETSKLNKHFCTHFGGVNSETRRKNVKMKCSYEQAKISDKNARVYKYNKKRCAASGRRKKRPATPNKTKNTHSRSVCGWEVNKNKALNHQTEIIF